jgi:hypothetical protein
LISASSVLTRPLSPFSTASLCSAKKPSSKS